MRRIDPLLAEFERESATTRRLLEHIPEERFAWRPSEKGMSLGELAFHVATIPAAMTQVLGGEAFDIGDRPGPPPAPTTSADLLASFDQGIAAGREFLDGLDDESAAAEWRLTKGGEPVFTLPRIVAIRSFLFNHVYHHRGQLSAYLRIGNCFVPTVYGPTADENPFE